MAYAPRSPDLSGAGYAPRSPDLSGLSSTTQYAPRSPNLSGLGAPAHEMPVEPSAQHQYQQQQLQQLQQQQIYGQPNPYPQQHYLNVPGVPANPQYMPQPQALPTAQTPSSKPRARKASSADDLTYSPSAPASASKPPGPGRGRRKKQKLDETPEEEPTKPAPGALEGIDVKTKFPVARIKRIMQHDEEVGKVSQVTPTAVSKALELFMISIVLKSAAAARAKGSKKVTVGHMKGVVAAEAEFDFLTGVCEKWVDSSAGRGKKGKKSEVEEEEEGED